MREYPYVRLPSYSQNITSIIVASRLLASSGNRTRPEIGPTYGLTDITAIRGAIDRADTATIAWIPTEEKIRIINLLFDERLLRMDNFAAIGKVYQNTPSSQRPAVRQVIVRRLPDLTMFQWARLHLLSGGEV